jgi:asparagine synthase (glutamine-hydrolysing)
MCGIAGFIDHSVRAGTYDMAATARAMADTLAHRGPDDGDVWVDPAAGLALSHRRLSIIDLSAAGRQPMVSACGRYVINYNGEVYSHAEIRADLEARGARLRGHSDTEVILEACATFGIRPTLERLIGMFAIALWDRETRTLTLVRDRLGIKPVYWSQQGNLFLFASELKALRAHPGWRPELDRDAVAAFLRYAYVPAPLSVFRGVHKLEPGSILTLSRGGQPQIERFWDARSVVSRAVSQRLDLADEEAAERLEHLLKDAIKRRMIADVPLGAFLSGGTDSSTVVALMQAQSARPVRTFSIGFHDGDVDEAPYAKAVAAHLGTDHTELYVNSADALSVIPRLPDWYDEPFADSSQIPTFLVSSITRKHVTVALSGDGGDELFAGYNRYAFAEGTWNRLRSVPSAVRRGAGRAVEALSPMTWDRMLAPLPRHLRPSQAGDKMHKVAAVLGLEDSEQFYLTLVSQWQKPDALVEGGHEPHGILWDQSIRQAVPDFVERMQFLDLVTYLPDDILAKVDRASMAVSLEARVPLLDHRVVEFAFRLPKRFKRRDGVDKWLLRRVLGRFIPKALIERPKMGFAVPIDVWLRGPLRDWAQALLEPSRLARDGLLRPEPILRAWQEHLAGTHNRQHQLWTVLMLQSWRERWAI